jgi:hypothetical protein
MKSGLLRKLLGAASAAALTAGLLVQVSTAAHAVATTPPWEPDPNGVGTLTFYDNTGAVVTGGGLDDSPIAAYAVGSGTPRAGDVSALLYGCLPVSGENTGLWSCDQLSSATSYPLASGPANIKTLSDTEPVHTGANNELTLNDLASDFPNDGSVTTDPDYEFHYQIRLRTSNSGGNQSTSWDEADIVIDTGANTWTQVYPTAQTLPGAPTAVVAKAGDGGAVVTFAAPADTGGGIQGYDIRYSSNGGTSWTSASSLFHTRTTLRETVTGLTNGTSYVFEAAAINTAGTGPYSSPSAAAKPLGASALALSTTHTIRNGSSETISATLTDPKTHAAVAHASVVLLSRTSSSRSFARLATLTTGTGGVARSVVSPRVNTQYEWTYPGTSARTGVTSAVQRISVEQVVGAAATTHRVASRRAFTIWGTVRPAAAGEVVVLQRLIAGVWHRTSFSAKIARQRMPSGRLETGYVMTVRETAAAAYSFRARGSATTHNVAGLSATVSVTVT